MNSHTSRVAFARCRTYEEGVLSKVRGLLDELGGIGVFVQPGQRVLVKPNMITDTAPEIGKTTHPEVVRAVLRLLKSHGAEPFVADSPASVLKLERVWEQTGILAVCNEESVPLVNLEQGGSEEISRDGFTFTIARRVLDADAVITVPKVKTHVMTSFTGAVKNLYGCIPGLQKTGLHKRYFRMRKFGKLLSLLYERIRPVLAVADGIVAMEGNGPTSGDLVPWGVLAASGDSVALDASICRLIGIDVAAVPYFGPLEQAGLGQVAEDAIEIVGDTLDGLEPRNFQPPNTLVTRSVPAWAIGLAGPFLWIRPSFTERCVSCGLCVRTCPADALTLAVKGSRPVLDKKKCIECCCCHEVCPQKAVDMELSPLFRITQNRYQAMRV